jgi:hypothetical protein
MRARFYVPAVGRFASADIIVPNPKDPQAFNRYSYVLNSPLVYTDPSGHCIPDYNCPGDTPFPPSEPGKHVSGAREKLAGLCDVIATGLDFGALTVSASGAALEGAAFLVGGVDPAPFEEGGAVVLYWLLMNPLENMISSGGAGAAALGDWLGGNSYFDSETGEIVIGQNTMVSWAALVLGNQSFIPLEGVGDTIVNFPLVVYDLGRLAEGIPSVVETRIGFNLDRGGLYMDLVVYGELAGMLGMDSGTRIQIMLNLSSEGGVVPWDAAIEFLWH